MNMILESLQTITSFLTYFGVSVLMVLAFQFLYMLVTPHNEMALVKSGNIAASAQYSGAILGFCLPLASAISHSVSLYDFVAWGAVALVVQILVFFIFSRVLSDASKKIADNNIAVGVMMGFISVSFGVINAACMTY